MLMIDKDSGTFAFSLVPERARELPECVVQVWAATDYLTVGWDAFVLPEPIGDLLAVMFIWAVDEDGQERQVSLGSLCEEGDGVHVDRAGAGLVGVSEYPAMVPDAIRHAVREREATRMEAWKKTAACLDEAEGRNVWLRLFGGATAGGKVKGLSSLYVDLDRPRRLSPLEAHDPRPSRFVELRSIAAARLYPGRRMPKNVASPLFDEWVKETDVLATTPQLWKALCPGCINSVRPPWRTGDCYRCRVGKPIELPPVELGDIFAD